MLETIFISYKEYMKLKERDNITNALVLSARENTLRTPEGEDKFVIIEYDRVEPKLAEEPLTIVNSRFEGLDFLDKLKDDIICVSNDLLLTLPFTETRYIKLYNRIMAFGDMQYTPKFLNKLDIKFNKENFKDAIFNLNKSTKNYNKTLLIEEASIQTLTNYIDSICGVLNYRDMEDDMSAMGDVVVDRFIKFASKVSYAPYCNYSIESFSRYLHKFSQAAVDIYYDMLDKLNLKGRNTGQVLRSTFFLFVNEKSDIPKLDYHKLICILERLFPKSEHPDIIGVIFARIISKFTKEELNSTRVKRFIYRYSLYKLVLDGEPDKYLKLYAESSDRHYNRYESIYYYIVNMYTNDEFYNMFKVDKYKSDILLYKLENDIFFSNYRGIGEIFPTTSMTDLEREIYNDNKDKFIILFDSLIDLILDDDPDLAYNKASIILSDSDKIYKDCLAKEFLNRLNERYLEENVPNLDVLTQAMIEKTI